MRNNNQAIIRKITGRAMRSDKRLNFFIIAAIALTALLLTTIFNIGMSLYETFQAQGVDFTGQIPSLGILVILFMFTGYLLVYNVLNISVSRNVRFYGLLKTIGTTPKQIRRIVSGQVLRLCVVGIPIGLILGAVVSFLIIPLIVLANDINANAITSFSPYIYVGTIIFTLITTFIGAAVPSKKAARTTAIEAVRNTGEITITSRANSPTHGKPYKMAFRNIFRERKRAVIVLLSLFMGVTVFIIAITFNSSLDVEKYIISEYGSDLHDNAFIEEARQAMRDSKTTSLIMSSAMALIIGLIGIMNFINVMSIGVVGRKREFAILESVGMSKKQLRQMLIYEGLGYAIITLVLAALPGNAIAYGNYLLWSHQWGFLTFTYPLMPMLIIGLVILFICIIAPIITYRSISQVTIVERLRETE